MFGKEVWLGCNEGIRSADLLGVEMGSGHLKLGGQLRSKVHPHDLSCLFQQLNPNLPSAPTRFQFFHLPGLEGHEAVAATWGQVVASGPKRCTICVFNGKT